MFRRRTTRIQPNRQISQLQARVMSPRILWLRFLDLCRGALKLALCLSVLAALAWGVWAGVDRCLFRNDEFALQSIRLTPNIAVDERRLVEVGGIDIHGTLFDCDVEEIRDRLLALPEVVSATVRREFPGTLKVDLTARQPVAWVVCESQRLLPRDPDWGMLADAEGYAFRCPPGMLKMAMDLPCFILEEDREAGRVQAGSRIVHPGFERLLGLYHVAMAASPDARWIDSIRQSKPWALELVARDGMKATFGLGDHPRQMHDLMAAVEHTRTRNQQIASINLIPRVHLPVRLKGAAFTFPDEGAGTAQRGILLDEKEDPVSMTAPAPSRRDRDLKQLLNRR